jgi:DNA-directed RNA polymerase I, II, and III subunit RPABC2
MSDDKDFVDEFDNEDIEQEGAIIDIDEDDDVDAEEDESGFIENKRETRFDIVNLEKTYENYYTQKKETKPFLTKFERAKLIGTRAEMIANGAPALVEVPKTITNAYDIAKLEFKERKIPLLIRRYLPNGTAEDWRLQDMVVFE